MPKNRISVVIPAYNAGQCLARAIDSVLKQTYQDFEIIVVNDGSTDNTGKVAAEYGNKITYIYQENAGVSVARNRGIEQATGEWIAFLDADDEFLSDKLQLQVALLERNPKLRWCTGNFFRSFGDQSALRFKKRVIKKALNNKEYFNNYFLEATKIATLATPTMMIHRDVLKQVGGFEPGRKSSQDLDLWWRIGHHYPSLGYCIEPLVVVHLDIYNPELIERRLERKRAKNSKELLNRHLVQASELGDDVSFKSYASSFIKERLLEMLFNGLHDDAKETVKEFPQLFNWYWFVLCFLITSFPKLSVYLMHKAAYLAKISKLERQVTRRWIHINRQKD